jgi:hypothetical protein
MSLPSIFVTADEAAAKRMELNHALPGDDVAEMGGIDTLKMSTLWAIIDRAAWQVESMDAFTEVFARESEWLHRVPDELTRKVAALPSDERPRVMREWSATEAVQPDTAITAAASSAKSGFTSFLPNVLICRARRRQGKLVGRFWKLSVDIEAHFDSP